MTNTPEVSIIIPAYNEAARLARCLDAPLRARTERDWEVLVIDDGSVDGTADVARTLGARVIQFPCNQGVAAARNAGAREARGTLLIFVDGDVVAPLETLYALADRLKRDPDVHAMGACPGENLGTKWSARFLKMLGEWYMNCYVRSGENVSCFPSECGAVRRETFFAAGGFPETHGGVGMEEFALGHAMECRGWRNVLLPDVRYHTYYDSVGERYIELMSRTARWMPLFLRRRRIEPTLGSRAPIGEALSCLLVALMLVSAIGGVLLHPLWWITPAAVAAHILMQSSWLRFVYRNAQGGALMALLSWPIFVAMHLSIVIGAAWGVLRLCWNPDLWRNDVISHKNDSDPENN